MPINVTLLGMTSEVIFEHPANAYAPMDVRWLEKVIVVTLIVELLEK